KDRQLRDRSGRKRCWLEAGPGNVYTAIEWSSPVVHGQKLLILAAILQDASGGGIHWRSPCPSAVGRFVNANYICETGRPCGIGTDVCHIEVARPVDDQGGVAVVELSRRRRKGRNHTEIGEICTSIG